MFGKDQSHFPFMTLKINFEAFFISFTKKTYHLEFWGKAYVHNYPHMKIYFQPPPPFPHQVEQNTYSLIWGGGPHTMYVYLAQVKYVLLDLQTITFFNISFSIILML